MQIYIFHVNFILIAQLQCNECSFKIINITEVSGEAVSSILKRDKNRLAAGASPGPHWGSLQRFPKP